MLISFVIPCYRSSKTLPQVVDTIQDTMKKRPEFESEIILVNDESPDSTWDTIRSISEKYDNIIGIDLAKNSGQQCAIMAGLRQAKGDYVAVSDDDGQTPVECVFEFYDKMHEGNYDVICADYEDRGKRSLFRRMGSWANNAMVTFFLDRPDNIATSVFFLAKRFVIDEMVRYDNSYPHMEGLLLRSTHNIGNVRVNQKNRAGGSSGYNLRKLMSTWINGLTTFSIKPLRIAVILGMLMSLVGFIIIICIVINRLIHDDVALGWSSIIATVVLIGGIITLILGVIGEYVGRIYLSLNRNPQYTIRDIIVSGEDRKEE